ncbi:MAG: hypothetical protein IPM74_10230 [Crocinitomicaceae bacterium]|nr:hypothetical protein [Crocinitomicaceae bacterium]MBK8926269.1 hypothetical protein [Crocinitomicaceae bacterium]
MKSIHLILFFVLLFVISSCNKEKHFGGEDFYEDGFENYQHVDSMFLPWPNLDKYWSFKQLTFDNNFITLDTTMAHSGNNSVHCFGVKSNDVNVSKASINRQHMAFHEGETIRITAWFFIQDTISFDWLFLIDLEEYTAIGAGPGMRVALVDNHLAVEHKFNEPDIFQPAGNEIDFPRNQWVEVVWEIGLSQKKDGTVKLWQDGTLLLEGSNTRTMPKDLLYFIQGTKGIYSNIEFGVTANSYDNNCHLWVDDVKVEMIN